MFTKIKNWLIKLLGGFGGTVGSMYTMLGYSQQNIDNAPTILEAEAKENG